MADLSDAVRLFYIATWQLADDGGYFEWNVPEIAMQLYGYQPRRRREQWVRDRAAVLVGIGRLALHDCGHAFVTHLTEHQRLGGTKAEAVSVAHHAEGSADLRALPQSSAPLPLVGEGRGKGEVKGKGDAPTANADLPDPTTNCYAMFEVRTGKPPSMKEASWIDELVRDFDRPAVAAAIRAEHAGLKFLSRVSDRLRHKEGMA